MDKNSIKKFAVWARRELIKKVATRAALYGMTEEGCGDKNADSIDGRVLTATEKKQRVAFIDKVRTDGYEQAIEEVAYTWFNRFCALRYMEVNGYLPTRVRVFTDDDGKFKPQIIDEAIDVEMDGLDMETVYAYKDEGDEEGLYRYLLITQCNALSPILPGMFQKIEDYTELLLPDYLLREGSVIEQMVAMIPEEDWTDQVQIIGWLYQYYNAEKKDEVFAALKKNVKVTKENIPAATQLFTPDWIVRYMVENSLGRLWAEGHGNKLDMTNPSHYSSTNSNSNSAHSSQITDNWKYYLPEAEQEPEVQAQLNEIRKGYAALKPEDIRCIDPCAGSGHILVYLFDVLVQIYADYGYTTREAVRSIIEHNLYGLDIDERAAQLAYFAVMMKARSYDTRFLTRKDEDGSPDIPQPHVYAIRESNGIDANDIKYFTNNDPILEGAFGSIAEEMRDAKEYGSIINITPVDFSALYARADEILSGFSLHKTEVGKQILPLIQVAETLAQKYNVVITNPPYMGAKSMSTKLAEYCANNYPNTKFDLFSVFIEKGTRTIVQNGFSVMVTMQSWMFLSSFEKMRGDLLNLYTLKNLLHMGNMVMGIAFGTAVSTIWKNHIKNYVASFSFVEYGDIKNEKPIQFPVGCERDQHRKYDIFSMVPGMPIVYWASDTMLKHFECSPALNTTYELKQGLITANNEKFLRQWSEVPAYKLIAKSDSIEDFTKSNGKWLPYNKGGDYRKWYGNNNLVVNWENDGFEIRNFKNDKGKLMSRPQNIQYFGKEGASWSIISNGKFSLRYTPSGFGFDARGSMMFANEVDLKYGLAFMCSKVASTYIDFLCPTVSFEVGSVGKVPFILSKKYEKTVISLAEECIHFSKLDWDSFETSWDFKRHPLI